MKNWDQVKEKGEIYKRLNIISQDQTDNAMTVKKTNRHKTHQKLKTDQHKPHQQLELITGAPEG